MEDRREKRYYMKKNKPITVGIDFDGVLAYNPFRIIRAPITAVKRNLFGEKKTNFYIPKTPIERAFWTVLHESSIFPAQGVGLLGDLIQEKKIEAHLVTARYSFLQQQLFHWLKKNKLDSVFSTITINQYDQQPHLYKSSVIKEKKFDYFIEDNLDIVEHVTKQSNTKVLWIYNLVDRNNPYPHKFPHLKKALEHIVS